MAVGTLNHVRALEQVIDQQGKQTLQTAHLNNAVDDSHDMLNMGRSWQATLTTLLFTRE